MKRIGRSRICIPITTAFLFAFPCLLARAADWPQWRGPDRDNVSTETGLLKQWPEGGPALAWTARGLGAGFSSVSISGGRIFTMGDDRSAAYLMALDESDGKKLWSLKIGRTGGDAAPGPRSTPTVSGNVVLALGQWGDLVCAEAASGKERWRRNLVSDFAGTRPGWEYTESVLVDGEKVICTPGGVQGTLAALDRETGRLLWRSKDLTDAAAYASPVLATIGGKRQYVQLTSESVFGVDPDTGNVLWRAVRQGQTAVIPTPIVRDNFVFVTSGYGVGCNLFEISHSGAQFSARQVYANREMVNHHGGVVRVGDWLYGSSDPGILKCIDFKTGDVKWKERSIGKGALAYADGRLYLRSELDGKVALIDAKPNGYKEEGLLRQPSRSNEPAWAHPVISGGKLYLRDQDVLLCYDIRGR